MMKRVLMMSALLSAFALVLAPEVQAQTGVVAQSGTSSGLFSPWTDRIFVNLNLNGSTSSRSPLDLTGGSTFTKYDEQGSTTSSQTITFKKPKAFDVSGGVRVWWNLGVGVGYSSSSTLGDGVVSASVPHPLVYNMPRTAGGTMSGLDHFESAFHVSAIYVAKLPMNFEVAVSAGPSFFKVSQDTIGAIGEDSIGPEASPYTTITLTQPKVIATTANKTGFNVGVDVAYFSNLSVSILSNVGVGVFVKYAGTTIDLKPEGSATPISMKLGGVQAGAGLRIRFKIGP